MKFWKTFIAAILIYGGIVACDNVGDSTGDITSKGDMDRTGTVQSITVNVYESKRAMQQAKADRVGGPANSSLQGWSEWSPTDEGWGCTIHVAKIPSLTSNSAMSTWGHELAHCMYGTYHKEL